ncbi:DHA1 family bicyclomycin/chloramphenicol resistance-like MFS transporter [Maritimibacter alkaliphilus HTCC2654]|uniref:Multidrug (Bicyclomycin) efflux pump, Major facilitator superfamily protein (MFS) n=1 Tax=Maritimibacter alkaliphilus HTCC2654 TaxID=314271 RepID=A3VLB5_9RHOB|nr:multidrug effflux MFS transporter [Maritimibacter alkaliphilus]EAQ10920.1 multidrug (bicyclomycin) efflux pump, Major facilitator superfamily protein (MFS) [Rhodobacterales bacterium HTCC2654] [Maritimibacter alkaliphilus HTCC2654]TYP81541.1 DHA1 family bicyclomycin/chloramphenicol resistance-like MFS transporter [Maritimibacter alkaliphilus HTCC2654]
MSYTSAPTKRIGTLELVAILAGLMSLMAFTTDSMLPAMTDIAAEMARDDKSRTQYLVSIFLLGGAAGMLLFGPLADSIGRRGALAAGIGTYVVAAIAGVFAPSLELLILSRFFMGFGAAAARIVSQTVTRDLFSGAEQARIASLIFMFFVVVPAAAPLLGQQIIFFVGWRGLFGVYVLFGLLVLGWFLLRQPETLDPAHRRAFRIKPILAAAREVLTTPVSRRYLAVQVLMYGQFIAYLSAAEQLWVDALGVGDMFPVYFAIIALLSAGAGFINSRLVMRVGMRRMLIAAFGSQTVFATLAFGLWTLGGLETASDPVRIGVFMAWTLSLFFINGLTLGNVTALAMEPLPHVAGTASAVIGAFGMGLGMPIAAAIGQAFDGTPRPIMLGAVGCSCLALTLVLTDMGRERKA